MGSKFFHNVNTVALGVCVGGGGAVQGGHMSPSFKSGMQTLAPGPTHFFGKNWEKVELLAWMTKMIIN